MECGLKFISVLTTLPYLPRRFLKHSNRTFRIFTVQEISMSTNSIHDLHNHAASYVGV